VHGRGRQPRAYRKIGQPIAFVVFGQHLDDGERAVDRLNAAIPGIRIIVDTGFRIDQFAPDHVSLHRDLPLSGIRP
jgi:hypothetical protein